MKKYILGILSLVILTACNSFDEPTIENAGENENNTATTEKYFVYANINGSSDTRVDITPSTNANGKPIIKVNWAESGEQFLVYKDFELSQSPYNATAHQFSQVSGNQFTGNFQVYGIGYSAFYNCSLNLNQSGPSTFKMDYDMSEQNGTGDKVLMMGKSKEGTSVIDFDHLGFILKPTFKYRSAGESTPRDMDALITKIEMGGDLKYVNDEDSKKQITVTPTSALDDIYIFLPKLSLFPYASEGGTNSKVKVQYKEGDTFTFNVTTSDGKEYTAKPLTLPASPTLEAGKFYTATIDLAETRCYLPKGTVFKQQLVDCIESYGKDVYGISFEANSNKTGTELIGSKDSPVSGSPAYFVVNNGYIEIHSAAETFVFNSDCSNMFSADDGDNKLLKNISYAYFTNCDTSQVTDMSEMFAYCHKLIHFENFNFKTLNVTNMYRMFYYCGNDDITPGDIGAYLNLSSFDTQNVTNMKEMFYKYRGNSLDISNFKMSNVETVDKMFSSTKYLKDLKLGNFSIPNNCVLTDMFAGFGTGHAEAKIHVSSQDIIDRLTDPSSGTGVTIEVGAVTPSHISFVLPTPAN